MRWSGDVSFDATEIEGTVRLNQPCNWTGVKVSEPDHQLIRFRSISSSTCERIIRDVGHQVLPCVAPLPRRIDRLDLRKLHVLSVHNHVWV